MMKREALKRCRDQWQQIYDELVRMDAAQRDDELFQKPTFNMLKRRVLETMGIPTEDHPINSCYLCEYALVDGVSDVWEQCEPDGSYGSYFACEDAYDDECFGDAADYAQEIIDACDEALNDLEDDNDEA